MFVVMIWHYGLPGTELLGVLGGLNGLYLSSSFTSRSLPPGLGATLGCEGGEGLLALGGGACLGFLSPL
jgi:hypothetical protein